MFWISKLLILYRVSEVRYLGNFESDVLAYILCQSCVVASQGMLVLSERRAGWGWTEWWVGGKVTDVRRYTDWSTADWTQWLEPQDWCPDSQTFVWFVLMSLCSVLYNLYIMQCSACINM